MECNKDKPPGEAVRFTPIEPIEQGELQARRVDWWLSKAEYEGAGQGVMVKA